MSRRLLHNPNDAGISFESYAKIRAKQNEAPGVLDEMEGHDDAIEHCGS